VIQHAPAERLAEGCAPRAGLPVLRIGPLDAAARPWARLSFDDASFDVVVCRQALQLFADRGGALSEIRRVLVPGGRLSVEVWGRLGRNPGFAALAGSLERRSGVLAASAVHWLFSLSEPDDVRALLAAAGFDDIRLRTVALTARFPSVAGFLREGVPPFPIGAATSYLTQAAWDRIAEDLEAELTPWIEHRWLTLPTEMIEATAAG
jgi:SAM-dependent methyltransferase